VHEEFVMRLNHVISDSAVEELNEQFANILVKGKIKKSSATSEEANEPDLAHLPRLIFYFNRRNWGQLRQLIDFLNTLEPESK
jgi:hypothetical protein